MKKLASCAWPPAWRRPGYPAGALDYAIDAPEGGLRQAHLSGGGTHGRRRGPEKRGHQQECRPHPAGLRQRQCGYSEHRNLAHAQPGPGGYGSGRRQQRGMPVVFPPSVDTFTAVPAEPEQETESGGTLGYTRWPRTSTTPADTWVPLKIPAIGLSVPGL